MKDETWRVEGGGWRVEGPIGRLHTGGWSIGAGHSLIRHSPFADSLNHGLDAECPKDVNDGHCANGPQEVGAVVGDKAGQEHHQDRQEEQRRRSPPVR